MTDEIVEIGNAQELILGTIKGSFAFVDSPLQARREWPIFDDE